MAQGPIIEASDLSVVREGRELVRVERFVLEPGEVHVLLGPNGAGKTTLLRALNGLEPARGHLQFEGREVLRAADRLRLRRRTAAVFQHAYLLSTTVRGNVEGALRLRGVRGRDLHRRADEALDLLGIVHLADRRRAGLSGGEAQRVSIARALAVDPVVLFLDEPMASLDPPTRRALLADLQQIFARLSMAVLWVTHDTEEAHAVADRVTFLAAGRVLQEGSRGQVFDTPASVEVADYLGIDVWLEGVVVNGIGGASRLVLPGGAGLVCPETDPGPAFACIHPEDVILFLAPPESSETSLRNIVKAQVQATRRVGRSMLVTLHWEGGRLDALVTRAACEELEVVPGQDLYAAVKATAIQVVPRGRTAGRDEETTGRQ